MSAIRNVFSLILAKNINSRMNYYKGPERPMDEIRQNLAKFSGGSVDLDILDKGIAMVTLNNPEKKNAISGKMMADLCTVVEQLEDWKEGKGVLLKGKSQTFCSGGDLDFARQTGTAEEGFEMATLMHNILSRFQRLPMILVALVDGAGALGGGAEISTVCDYRLITERCYGIGFVHARLGIVPAWGGTNRLLKILGRQKALDLLATAKIMKPEECLNVGLVDEIISNSEEPECFALEWLREKTKYNTAVIRALKSTIMQAEDNTSSLEFEKRMFAPLWGGEANKEALEKRLKHK